MATKTLKNDEILIGEKIFTLKPIKMKYIKKDFYSQHVLIKKLGLIKLMTYIDGEEIIKEYLKATFDIEEIEQEILDNIDAKILSSLREKVKELNEIEDEPENPNE